MLEFKFIFGEIGCRVAEISRSKVFCEELGYEKIGDDVWRVYSSKKSQKMIPATAPTMAQNKSSFPSFLTLFPIEHTPANKRPVTTNHKGTSRD